ncbi:hypothetical protein JJB11_12110 [Ramlibacter ginsenosidimutans]|uniref:Uncharacterized protein n=1 Tax=Ramlibacter ginsenosidimutans TaxID=502333 RepID=A0A934TTY2_9BURK|nr:hypothetical protein [Ramlibacter ginsenosidimutans]MBK6006835.1 hypothetical protein [Ramlibacter ginsenosidimutans]
MQVLTGPIDLSRFVPFGRAPILPAEVPEDDRHRADNWLQVPSLHRRPAPPYTGLRGYIGPQAAEDAQEEAILSAVRELLKQARGYVRTIGRCRKSCEDTGIDWDALTSDAQNLYVEIVETLEAAAEVPRRAGERVMHFGPGSARANFLARAFTLCLELRQLRQSAVGRKPRPPTEAAKQATPEAVVRFIHEDLGYGRKGGPKYEVAVRQAAEHFGYSPRHIARKFAQGIPKK